MKESANQTVDEKHILPRGLGYRMQAEWEPHEATWISWPHNKETWSGRVREIEKIYLQMIEALALGEKVRLLVNDEKTRDRVAGLLEKRKVKGNRVVYYLIPTVDAWIRDYGPTFILKGSGKEREIALVRWRFNAWGGKYALLAGDDRIQDELVPILGIPVFRPGLILEGGSIDTNGLGTALVTEQCLLNPNRNPHLSKLEIDSALKNFLGLTHVIWLGEGIEGDDTDGHIDDIARFVNPTMVVAAIEKDSSDANGKPLRENLERLKRATDQNGKKFELITLPMPGRVEDQMDRLPASYLNFYIGNAAVLVPIFGHPNDAVALKTLEDLFPKRKVIGIRSKALVLGLGGIHCVTHEEPAKEIL